MKGLPALTCLFLAACGARTEAPWLPDERAQPVVPSAESTTDGAGPSISEASRLPPGGFPSPLELQSVPPPFWHFTIAGIANTGDGTAVTQWAPTDGTKPSFVPDVTRFGQPTYKASAPAGVRFERANGEALFADGDLTTVEEPAWTTLWVHTPSHAATTLSEHRGYLFDAHESPSKRLLFPHMANLAVCEGCSEFDEPSARSPPYRELGYYTGNTHEWWPFFSPRGLLVHTDSGTQVTAFSLGPERQAFGRNGKILAHTENAFPPRAIMAGGGGHIVLGAAGNVADSTSGTFYDGVIHEFKFWSSALSDAELVAAMQSAMADWSLVPTSYKRPFDIDSRVTLFLERGQAEPANGTFTRWEDQARASVWVPQRPHLEPTNSGGEPSFDGDRVKGDGLDSHNNLRVLLDRDLTSGEDLTEHSGYILVSPSAITANSTTPGANHRLIFTSTEATLLVTLRNTGSGCIAYVGHATEAVSVAVPCAPSSFLVMWVYDGNAETPTMSAWSYWAGGNSDSASGPVSNLSATASARVVCLGRNQSGSSVAFAGTIHEVLIAQDTWPEAQRLEMVASVLGRHGDLLE